MDLNGQKAVVFGALGRVGRSVARKLCSEGASVVVSARRKEKGEALAAELRADGFDASFVHARCGLSTVGSSAGERPDANLKPARDSGSRGPLPRPVFEHISVAAPWRFCLPPVPVWGPSYLVLPSTA